MKRVGGCVQILVLVGKWREWCHRCSVGRLTRSAMRAHWPNFGRAGKAPKRGFRMQIFRAGDLRRTLAERGVDLSSGRVDAHEVNAV